jgi:ADP-ribosylglycohydrolase
MSLQMHENATRVTTQNTDQLIGVLLGMAVGDALGLPREGLSPRRAARMFPGPLRHRFVFGRGMISDDMEHACMTAQALLRAPNDPDGFARSLAWRLRGWLLGIPAGIGLATLRAIVRLWFGFPPHRSGVFSAGNGPAMRAPVLGVCLGDDLDRLRRFVRASTRLTHTDPKAERGAMLIALAAHHAATCPVSALNADGFLDRADLEASNDPELASLLAKLREHLRRNAVPAEFAAAFGLQCGVSGYMYHTLPVALYCWLRSPGDFERAVTDAILLGGDADTAGAIVGGLAGAGGGASAIPQRWLNRLMEFPRSPAWIRRVGEALGDTTRPARSVPLAWPFIPLRNLAFVLIVLLHEFRRLLPPY